VRRAPLSSRARLALAAGNGPPLSRRALLALAAGTGLMITGALPAFLTASLASRIPDDFAFGDSGVGLAIAVFHVICAVCSTPAGRLVERIGPVAGMRVAATATATCCLAIAALAQSAAGLTALLVLGGLANAFGGPSVSALLKREVAIHRQGLAFGAQQSGGTLGSLLAGLALPAVAIPFGWRWAFVAVAVLALAAAAAAPASTPAEAPAARPARPRGLTSVHALALAAALASAAGVGFISFLVLFAVNSGMSQAEAGLLLGAVSLAATAGRLGVGALADRPGQEPLRTVAAMLAASIAGYLLLIAAEPALIVVAALVAGGCGWAWPGGLTLAVVQRSPAAPAWAVGVLMAGLFSGAIAGPLAIGVLAEHERFAYAWGVCAACALLAAVTVAATRRHAGVVS
jgi:MFS family permease